MHVLPRLAVLVQTMIAAGTFLVAKDAAARFESLPLAWFRIVLSAVLMGAVYLIRARAWPRFRKRDWLWLAVLGLLGVTFNQGLFLYGIGLTSPLHASLLYAFTPALVLVGAVLMNDERFTVFRVAAVVCAMIGVALVLTARGLNLASGPLRGDLFILVAVVAWSLFTLLGKSIIRRLGAITVIAWAFVFGALSVIPFGPVVLRGFDYASPGVQGWLELLYLGAVTSGIAFTLWYWALKRLEASQVAVFTNLQAPMTAFLVWIFYGSVPGGQIILGGALVLLGVSLAQTPAHWRRRSLAVENSASTS